MQGPNGLLNTVTYPPGALQTDPRVVIDGVRGAIFVYGPGGVFIGSWAGSGEVDPYGNGYPEGLYVAVGVIQGITIVATNNGGEFLGYTANPPVSGSLYISISPVAGTDQYGDAFRDGVDVYGPNGAFAQMAVNQSTGVPYIVIMPPGSTYVYNPPQSFSGVINSGAANEQLYMQVESGTESNTGTTSQIQLFSKSHDATVDASLALGFQTVAGVVTNALTITPSATTTKNGIKTLDPGTANPAAFHVISYASGWSNVGGLDFTYYKGPDGFVHVTGQIQHSSLIGGSSLIGTIPSSPAGFVPTANYTMATSWIPTTSPYAATACTIQITTAGNITFYGNYTAGGQITVSGSYYAGV